MDLNKIKFCTAIIVIMALLAGCNNQPQDKLRQSLEKAYANFVQACKSGEIELVEESTSSWWFASTKNQYASLKENLTGENLQNMGTHFLDTTDKKFVKVIQKEATAGLVYMADANEPHADKPRVVFTVIKFVNENGSWRYHRATNFMEDKQQKDGTLTEFSEEKLGPEMAMDGIIPKAPELMKKPDWAGMIDVFLSGCTADVYVNNVKQSSPEPPYLSSSGLLWGGLQKGKNTLRLIVNLTEKKDLFAPRVTVGIRQIIKGKPVDIFEFKPSEKVVGTHEVTFNVNGE